MNFGSSAVTLKVSVDGLEKSTALSGKTQTVLTSDNVMDENSFKDPKKVTSLYIHCSYSESFSCC